MSWFYDRNGSPQGPFNDEELREHVLSGDVSRDTLVWTEGMDEWGAAGGVLPQSAQSAFLERYRDRYFYPLQKLAISVGIGAFIFILARIIGIVASRYQQNILLWIEAAGLSAESATNEVLVRIAELALLAQPFVAALILATFFIYLMWVHRCAKNIRISKPDARSPSPSMAVIWYFVPLAFLIMPIINMRSIVRHSMNVDQPGAMRVGGGFCLWALFYVLAAICVPAVVLLDSSQDNTLDILYVMFLFSILFALFTIQLVAKVTRHQAIQFGVS